MKIRRDLPISYTINPQLKDKTCTVNYHIECEIKVVEFDTFGCGQSGEQGTWNRIQISLESAYRYEIFLEGVRSPIRITSDEVVFNDKGLASSKVASVVK